MSPAEMGSLPYFLLPCLADLEFAHVANKTERDMVLNRRTRLGILSEFDGQSVELDSEDVFALAASPYEG